jgi:hypothetical protein
MPYFDVREKKEGFTMIETVFKIITGATKREIEKVYLARTVQRRIEHPPDERFKVIVSLGENGLRNCSLTVSDVLNVPVIFCPNLPRIKGTSTRDNKVPGVKMQRVAIPREFY